MERLKDTQDEKDVRRPIRRVRSPSRPRAWFSSSSKPKFVGHFHKPRDEHSFYKPGFGGQRHYPFHNRSYVQRRDHFQPKLHHIALRERERVRKREEREKEKEWREPKESPDKISPSKQTITPQPFSSRSTSSRDKDIQFTSNRNHSKERDQRRSKSKDIEEGRDEELPSTGSHSAARDRAIQQKRREIDQVYYQECEMFGLVTKMLIAKDPSLEQPIQSSLQENLRDIGKRCVDAMEKFIEDYDSRRPLH